MENTDVLLRATDLSLGYTNRPVLCEVNLEIRKGEWWFFLGRNGSGKTTLMRTLLGLLPPQAGSLWRHPQRAQRRHMGFVPQRCELNPTLPITVREFVLLGLAGIHLRRAEERTRIKHALEKMDLQDFTATSYHALSDGQRQRVLVARALVRQPTILFLDEPTSNLDVLMEDILLQNLAMLHEAEHLTLFFVSHNLNLATRDATHVGLVHEGTVHAGPRDLVLTEENLGRVYGDEVAARQENRFRLHVR